MSDFFSRYLPGLTVAAAVVYLVAALAPHADPAGEPQVQAFGKLPVREGGRILPIDSKARTTLMIISGKQTFKDLDGKNRPAVAWLLETMSSSAKYERALRQASTFHIPSPEVRKLLGLEDRPGFNYEIGDFTQHSVADLIRVAMRADQAQPGQRMPLDRDALAIAHQLRTYMGLRRTPQVSGDSEKYPVFRIENDQVLSLLGLESRSGLRYSIDEFRGKMGKVDESAKRAGAMDDKQRDLFDRKVLELRQHLELYLELAHQIKPQAVPSYSTPGEWKTLAEVRETGEAEPAAVSFNKMLLAYAERRPEQFNRELAAYTDQLEQQMPETVRQAKVEAYFNHFEPFYHCMVLYVAVFLLACFGFLFVYEPLNRAAFWLAILTLVVHTCALIARIYISGRPPVTNLYSSAIFIGWGCLVLALILEGVYHNGIGNLVGSVMGFGTVFIAHSLLATGDTLEMLEAVLDTNFWLATHVVCVTMGYTATFVAGALGVLFVLLGVCTPRLDRALFQTLGQMIYGVVCFATLLSFVGTVLGGIWADQSWGRFWGWDPKENGALLIVIWNALILHARWAGMVKQRGMAVLTIVGNMITLWSWFGTNQLGVGLHSYGINKTLAQTLTVVWGIHLLLIVIGLLPTKYWWSFATQRAQGA